MDTAWINFLRRSSRTPSHPRGPLRCPLCDLELAEHTNAAFQKHITDDHQPALDEWPNPEAANSWVLSLWKTAERNANRSAAAAAAAADRPVNDPTSPDSPDSPDAEEAPVPESPREVASFAMQPSQVPESTDVRASPTPSVKSNKRADGAGDQVQSPSKRVRAQQPPRSPALAGKDSRAEVRTDVNAVSDKPARGLPHKNHRRLWTPEDERPRYRSGGHSTPRHQGHPPSTLDRFGESDDLPRMVKQPETKPISNLALVEEVRKIYAGLVLVENKCMEVDNAQNKGDEARRPLTAEQWQILIALHRTLLNEHHDFFLASQHPAANPPLRELAAKYSMPARMWRHGIHSFLEMLRHRLPDSLEHMLMFIYLAYAMMALLYETVPAFQDTWVECLGDLGRYRMAIEDDDVRDRETWTGVSRHWYTLASAKNPTVGRLYHHLAILARPSPLRQQFYYCKSLCVATAFDSTRESILTLFEPVLGACAQVKSKFEPSDFAFIRCHAILFTRKKVDELTVMVDTFLGLLGGEFSRKDRLWQQPGLYIGITLCCALVGYGAKDNSVFQAILSSTSETTSETSGVASASTSPAPRDSSQDQVMDNAHTQVQLSINRDDDAITLTRRTHDIVFRSPEIAPILPYMHVTLVFMLHLTRFPGAMSVVGPTFPWKLVASRLNILLNLAPNNAHSARTRSFLSMVEGDTFPDLPPPEKANLPVPFPEDYALRGLAWAKDYFPDGWFSNTSIEDDERFFEPPSLQGKRTERAIWVARRIAEQGQGRWLTYDREEHQFGVAPEWDVDLDDAWPSASTGAAKAQTATTTGIAIADTESLPDAAARA